MTLTSGSPRQSLRKRALITLLFLTVCALFVGLSIWQGATLVVVSLGAAATFVAALIDLARDRRDDR